MRLTGVKFGIASHRIHTAAKTMAAGLGAGRAGPAVLGCVLDDVLDDTALDPGDPRSGARRAKHLQCTYSAPTTALGV